MVLFQGFQLKQRQSLVITPQLQQAIKLLQMSGLELQAFIENEVRENPLLTLSEDAAATETATADADKDNRRETPFEDAPMSINPMGPRALGAQAAGETDYDPFATLSSAPSLHDHLREQAQIAFASVQDRFVADYLIDLVDASGYIRQPSEDVTALLNVDQVAIARILSVLQTFDPVGVCARSLAECLALQLKEKDRLDPCMQRLLDHLDLLASSDFVRLRKVCEVDAEDLADMIREIRCLNPKPGAAFDHGPVQTLVPDILVRKGVDGLWRAELNPASAPALAMDRMYYESLKRSAHSDADKSYLKDRRNAANWLVNSLEQRICTILKVANALVEEQTAFFEHGVRHLKPLNLRQIALKIGMHESTVSRVTSNKAMATPRGLFEMKYFFTSAIASAGASDAHSSEAVRDRIKELILNEAPEHVLSDDRIVGLLQRDGIDIARRTVAKYREALRIPSSAARRRKKRSVLENARMAS